MTGKPLVHPLAKRPVAVLHSPVVEEERGSHSVDSHVLRDLLPTVHHDGQDEAVRRAEQSRRRAGQKLVTAPAHAPAGVLLRVEMDNHLPSDTSVHWHGPTCCRAARWRPTVDDVPTDPRPRPRLRGERGWCRHILHHELLSLNLHKKNAQAFISKRQARTRKKKSLREGNPGAETDREKEER